MQSYHLSIDDVFKFQMPVASILAKRDELASKGASGYFQVFGCTAATFGDARDVIIKHVKEEPFLIGHNDVIDEIVVDEVEEMCPDEVSRFMDENYGSVILLQDPSEEGIWYKSGHGFYWDDQSEHKNWRGIIDSLVRKIKHLVCCPVL